MSANWQELQRDIMSLKECPSCSRFYLTNRLCNCPDPKGNESSKDETQKVGKCIDKPNTFPGHSKMNFQKVVQTSSVTDRQENVTLKTASSQDIRINKTPSTASGRTSPKLVECITNIESSPAFAESPRVSYDSSRLENSKCKTCGLVINTGDLTKHMLIYHSVNHN